MLQLMIIISQNTMKLKRRQLLTLLGLSSLNFSCLSSFYPSTSYASDEAQKLTPLSTNPPRLRFISVADTGTGDRGQYAVANAMIRYHQNQPFDMVIMAGDNIYTNGEIEKIPLVFEKPYQQLLEQKVKFYACLGNHDIRTQNGDLQLQYPGFNMKGRYYTFRQELVQFFALDTNMKNQEWSRQISWLEAELSKSDTPWKVVFGHHPIYSSGIYGKNNEFIKLFTPLFQKYNVQVYINGHEHNYERTRSIDGTTYLICGAGAGSRPVGHSPWTAYATSELSFATFDVYDDKMIISGINTNAQVFDRGIIPLKSTYQTG